MPIKITPSHWSNSSHHIRFRSFISSTNSFSPRPPPPAISIVTTTVSSFITTSMATSPQASLFTPPAALPSSKPSAPRSLLPWKHTPLTAGAMSLRGASFRVSATEEKTEAAPEAPAGFTPPQLDPSTPSPIFGGSTGGLLRKAQVEEFYVITWDSPKEQVFEMPTGGAAIMRQGPNLLKLARKEQCLALGTRLRSKYKIKYQFYRVFPNGEVQYLHPKDGVYPEKVNPGRQGVGQNMRSIGKNVSPIEVKFTGKQVYDL
ncbi:photosystem I reaction center subunit II, chloroplastic-like [Musa acuminata AAA Group]|uniref:photosystem I reaction center subunit II, chloroplastic-like n=1 Tax=Musa acuminata AAA Group TaxID=214697 RepID=UPI0031E3C8D8